MPTNQDACVMSKTAIVTGGSSGIGYATAERLARRQFRVYLLSRDPQRGKAAIGQIRELAPDAPVEHIVCDVRSISSVRAAIARVATEADCIELLVNGAGVLMRAMLGAAPAQAVDDPIDTCLKGTVHVTGAAIELLSAASAPLVVNIGSVAGKAPFESLSVYGAAKAGVIQFSRIAAKELYSRGIRVVCVNPGVVRTGLMSTAEFSRVQATLPGKRLQQAHEIASFVVSLSAGAYASMTGAVIDLDDGAGLFTGGPPDNVAALHRVQTTTVAPPAEATAIADVESHTPGATPSNGTADDKTAQALAALFERLFGIDPTAVQPELSPDKVLKWDSIGHIRLVGAIEESLGVTFDVDEIMELTSVGAILDILERKVPA